MRERVGRPLQKIGADLKAVKAEMPGLLERVTE